MHFCNLLSSFNTDISLYTYMIRTRRPVGLDSSAADLNIFLNFTKKFGIKI